MSWGGAEPQGTQGAERGAWVEGCMTSQGRFLRRSAQDALPVFEDGLHVEKPRERRGWGSGWRRLAGAWGSRNTEQGEVAEAGATPGLWWPPWPSLSSLSPLPSPSHHCQCTCDADFKAPLQSFPYALFPVPLLKIQIRIPQSSGSSLLYQKE